MKNLSTITGSLAQSINNNQVKEYDGKELQNTDYRYKKEDGDEIWCFGQIEKDSNFYVACQDYQRDGIASDMHGHEFNSWQKVCRYLQANYSRDIEQISTC